MAQSVQARKPRRRGSCIQIIATPGSGNGRALAFARALRTALRARGHGADLEVFSDLDSLGRWAATGSTPFSLLVCVGGDGTLDTAAAAAVRRSVPFLAIPSGFGNLFGRALAQPRRVDRAVALIEHGELVHVDVGVRNGQLFLCQESFGLLVDIQSSAEASTDRPRARWRRGLAYYQTALRYLRETPLTPLRVSVDGRVVARDAVIVTVANVETYGPWLPLTPDASPIDGLLDVFAMRRADKRAILAALVQRHLRLAAGKPHGFVYRGREVSVAAPHRAAERLHVMPRRLPVLVSSHTAEGLAHGLARAGGLSYAGRREVA
jgi:diacylglycerol kinase (ATP)